jgi:hypothetical protein
LTHSQLRLQLLAAMGLAGCATHPAELEGSRAPVDVSDPAAMERVSVDRVARPVLEVDDVSWQSDRLGVFTITGVEPNSDVWINHGDGTAPLCLSRWDGDCVETVYPSTLLEGVRADAAGVAVITEPVPDYPDGGELVYQAVARSPSDVITVSEPVVGTVSNPVRACGEWTEVDPDDLFMFNRTTRYVCTDAPVCDPTLSPWQAKAAWGDALAAGALQPQWNINAFCLEETFTDRCCYSMFATSYYGGGAAGRPFSVAGGARAADLVATAGWCDELALPCEAAGVTPAQRARLAAYWIKLGRDEHASIASFSRFNLELLALGAPSDLLAASTRAIGDEIRHARIAWGVAAAWTGDAVGAGPIELAGALERSSDPAAVLEAAIREGCLNETISAAQARAAAEGAVDPALRAALTTVAEDEARHAELSWAFVRWMLVRHPELRELAARTFDAWSPGPAPAADPDRAALLAWGMTTDDLNHEVAVQVTRDVVVPCADALLGRDRHVDDTAANWA